MPFSDGVVIVITKTKEVLLGFSPFPLNFASDVPSGWYSGSACMSRTGDVGIKPRFSQLSHMSDLINGPLVAALPGV